MLLLTTIAWLLKDIPLLAVYVQNNAFPQPLSAEDEALYLQKHSEGDIEARNKLTEHNLRLVAHIVNTI